MKSNLGKAILGGLIGTVLMTLMMKFVAPMMGVQMDIAKNLADMMGTSHMIGLAAHFMLGTLIFPAIYVFLVYSFLAGAPVVRGMIFAVALWAILEIVLMPMMGMGLFGMRGPGPMGAMAALVAHLIYGASLGFIAGPAAKAVPLNA